LHTAGPEDSLSIIQRADYSLSVLILWSNVGVVVWCNTQTICKNTSIWKFNERKELCIQTFGTIFLSCVAHDLYFRAIWYSHHDISLVVSNWQLCIPTDLWFGICICFIDGFLRYKLCRNIIVVGQDFVGIWFLLHRIA
jgi:hypothetical protein